MKILSFVFAVAISAMLFGCGAPFIELTDNFGYTDEQVAAGDTDYSKAYLAIKSVLIEEFGANLVKENKYPGREHRKFVVYSRQNTVGAGKTRMKVIGFVGRDEFAQVTPVFYCTYQVEKLLCEEYVTPEAPLKLVGSDTSTKRFMDAARNEKLEATLHNKTMAKLNLGENKFSGLNNTLPSALISWGKNKPDTKMNKKDSNQTKKKES